MEIPELRKRVPAEERYSLTDQVRRSSRSVCAHIAAAWRERRHPASFVGRLSDADTEAGETVVRLDVAYRFEYVAQASHERLRADYRRICAQRDKMMAAPDKWCGAAISRPSER